MQKCGYLQMGSPLPSSHRLHPERLDARGPAVGLGLQRRRWCRRFLQTTNPSSFPISLDSCTPCTLLPNRGDAALFILLYTQRDTETSVMLQGYEIPPRLARHWEFNLSEAGTL